MGIDDRDYMRSGPRTNAKGFKPGAKKVPPHVVDMEFNFASGRWEEAAARPKAKRRRSRQRRWRPSNILTPGPMAGIGLALLLLFKCLTIFQDAQRNGHLPTFGTSQPFPSSGEFKVRGRYASGSTTSFTITAGERNAVVQLVGSDGLPVFMTFVRMNEMAAVLAPYGTWTLRLIEGDTWYGEQELFGINGVVEDSRERLTFDGNGGHLIDLRRRFNGNLHTTTNWQRPDLEGN
jgi:hypothetical protein